MNGTESTGKLEHMPYAGPSPIVDERPFSAKFRRLLDVSDVADWVGVTDDFRLWPIEPRVTRFGQSPTKHCNYRRLLWLRLFG